MRESYGTCPSCGGKGTISEGHMDGLTGDIEFFERDCARCDSTGWEDDVVITNKRDQQDQE